ncbi:hypothetical protein AB1L42_20165 [Thalassoglobus sp. JC818]|uniref:hypothetical protein n=1 Tax=Thalassoglobus sp. JC818 TaxID=3232136 RepID=UPI003458CE4C
MMPRLILSPVVALLFFTLADTANADFILFSVPHPRWDADESEPVEHPLLRPDLRELSFETSQGGSSRAKKSSNSGSLKSYLQSLFAGLALPEPVLPGTNPDGSPRYVPYITVEDFRERLGDNRYAKRLLNRFVKSDRLLFFPGRSHVDPEPVPEPTSIVLWGIALMVMVTGHRLRTRMA